MKVITEKDWVKEAPEKWKRNYFHNGDWGTVSLGDPKKIYDALCELNPESATASDVTAIIGNDSWCGFCCSECGKRSLTILLVGQEPDYESLTVWLCPECAKMVGALACTIADSG